MVVKLLLTCLLLASSALQEGERLFLDNKPMEALPHLEQALNENPADEKIYLYLGIVYEQINDPERAVQIMRRGLNIASTYKHLLYYNIGNNFFRQEEYTLAEQMYSKAIVAQNGFADSFLNRANARLQLESYGNARDDYIQYLRLAPDSPQKEQIEKLIALLAGFLEAQERQRQEELAKQEALLQEVLNSLNNASEDTRNLAAESEDIEEEYEEIDISD
jgi:tetratricopeptide (TPR) repeat protein